MQWTNAGVERLGFQFERRADGANILHV
jgi:hypothetical protein